MPERCRCRQCAGAFPLTGGSRLVQSGAVQAGAMRSLAQALLALVAVGGLWLAWYSGPALVLVGWRACGWAGPIPCRRWR